MPYTFNELNDLSEKEKEVALQILNQLSKSGKSEIYNDLLYEDYAEIPVDIETFITDDRYLGQAWKDASGKIKMYPFWMEQLKKLFPTNVDTDYNILLETGARGIGKSEIACGAVGTYLMYRILCLKNPLEFFHLKLTEKICFAFMNIKLSLAEEIAISKFQKTIQMSPWFMSKGTMTQYKNNPYWVPPEPINIIIGSQADDVIGKPIFFAFFDEISFIRNQDIDKQKEKAKDMIDTAVGGMFTRFIFNGKNPTVLAIGSSKRSEQSFMEQYIKVISQNENNKALVVDKPVWEVKPKGTYSSEIFYVAIGNKFLESLVIPDSDINNLDIYKQKGYKVIEVPIDFKAKFLEDLDRNLCDFAGISSSTQNKYISAAIVNDNINETYKNPFPDIIEVGNAKDDLAQYKNFFNMDNVPRELMYKPLFIHLDMSISGDMTGIAGVWIIGKKPSNDPEQQSKDLKFRLAFSTSVKAPKGHQISFEKNRNFIRWLKETGFKVRAITSDTFQSYDLQQQLSSENFECSILSVDRVDQDRICKPYQYLRSTLYEHRIEMYRSNRLFDEFIDIERNLNTGKIDHTPNGHKDALDAVCLGPNTQIYLLDGSHKTIKELYDEKTDCIDRWVLAYNIETNNLEPVKISDVVNNGYREELLKLYLDNGKELICTPDHKLLTRSGNYIEAKDSLGVSLMPFNYESKVMFKNREYPYVYIPHEDGTNKGIYLHKLVCENLYKSERAHKEEIKSKKEFIVIHHKDCNRFNNNPDNLEYLTNKEHSLKHTALNKSNKKRMQLSLANKRLIVAGIHPFQLMSKQQHAENGRKALINLNKSNKHRKAVSDNNKKLASKGLLSFQIKKENAHTLEANLKRYNTCVLKYGEIGFKSSIIQEKCRKSCLEHNGYDNPFHSKEKQNEMRINKLKKAYNKILSEFNLTEDDYMSLFDFKLYCYILHLNGISSKIPDIIESNLNIDISNYNEKDYKCLQNKGNCVRLFLKDTSKDCFTYNEFLNYYNQKCVEYDKNKEKSKFKFRFKDIPSYADIVKLGFKIYNHRVIKIEKIAGDYVYDLKLDKIHNFAITAGIFVHNCGATFNASKFAEEYAYNYGESLETVLSVNTNMDLSTKEQLTVEFEKELQQQFAPKYITNQQENITENSQNNTKENNAKFNDNIKEKPAYLDFGMGPAQIYKPQYFNQGIVYW